ncbi:GNAT family N-acetyltransferase [Halotia branconii]|uniref:GNAT family N-acetyltransferase n=1 Tax=Halotia branconii CENA392 TaxID=1539056 RepID=A0AAJ6NT00_9CYAN|nr:GNAT family N-acetyltransferase [Halotia branconii]WGV26045.1 GNAT family N-acetyltransferase [Halotia branconii CENA392]
MSEQLLPGYYIRCGSTLERSLLVKFMQRTYQHLFPEQDFAHLARTVEQYFSRDTPLWWVDFSKEDGEEITNSPAPIACLWVGNAIDQVQGDRHAHIFLLYVEPEHRRRGVGTALMRYIENWATQRGDRQLGLQVFQSNQPALNLYNQLGYQTQSLWMVKSLNTNKEETGV